jgi:hypothetical protein
MSRTKNALDVTRRLAAGARGQVSDQGEREGEISGFK